jgi:hypothetical protein
VEFKLHHYPKDTKPRTFAISAELQARLESKREQSGYVF